MASDRPFDPSAAGRPESGTASREGVILLVLAALQFVGIVDFMIVMPLGPQLLADLDIDARQFSRVVSAYTLSAGIAGFLVAPWLDRVPRKIAYLVASLGLLAGTVACALASTAPLLLAARCVTGGFGGVHGALALAIVADLFPPERRGRATGTLMSAFAVASVAGVPLGIVLGTRFGWRAPFYTLAALGLPLVVITAWVLPPIAAHTDGVRRHPIAHLVETLSAPAHSRALALIAVLMVGAFSVIPFISTAFVANAGVTPWQLPVVYIAVRRSARRSPRGPDGVSRDRARVGCDDAGADESARGGNRRRGSGGGPAHGGQCGTDGDGDVADHVEHRATASWELHVGQLGGAARRQRPGNHARRHDRRGGAGAPLRNFGTVGALAAVATLGSLWLAARIRPVD
ncbi:MAG: MFS transporter [Planctomycetaceae bacterium]